MTKYEFFRYEFTSKEELEVNETSEYVGRRVIGSGCSSPTMNMAAVPVFLREG